MKKSIVIGSNGYLGKHLTHFLEANKFKNENFDIHPSGTKDQKNYKSLDITNKSEFKKIDSNIDYIFLFAGLTGTTNGFEKYTDFIAVNEIGLLNLVTWMRESKCKARIVFPSTRLVYKGCSVELKEDDEKQTKTIYAANKFISEQILWMYHNAFGINYTIFRICVPYGNIFDKTFSYGTIGFFLKKAIENSNITLYGNGEVMRTFTHVEDICISIIKAIQKDESTNEIYNIGGENLSLLTAAQLISKKYNVSINFMKWPEMDLKMESGDTIFNSTKLDNLINYPPKFSLQKWIENL